MSGKSKGVVQIRYHEAFLGAIFFIFAPFGLIFGYCGANGCYFDMLKFQDSTSYRATSDWGDNYPGDNCPGNNCHRRQLTISQPLQARFKWDKEKLVYSNSTIQLATKLPLIGATPTQVTTAQGITATGDSWPQLSYFNPVSNRIKRKVGLLNESNYTSQKATSS